MTIDAIFICFVEDCDMNDGVTKPYFMSMGLMVSNTESTSFTYLPVRCIMFVFVLLAV